MKSLARNVTPSISASSCSLGLERQESIAASIAAACSKLLMDQATLHTGRLKGHAPNFRTDQNRFHSIASDAGARSNRDTKHNNRDDELSLIRRSSMAKYLPLISCEGKRSAYLSADNEMVGGVTAGHHDRTRIQA